MTETRATVPLSFPEIRVKRVIRDGKQFVLDPVRRTFVRLTPEEWVRQHALRFLIDVISVPSGLISVETAFFYNGMRRRADIVVFDRVGRPLIVVECKSPSITIGQNVFEQVSRYNTEMRAPYVIVTNGRVHYSLALNFENRSYEFLSTLPSYDELQQGPGHIKNT